MELILDWKHLIKIQKADDNVFFLSKWIPLPIEESSSLHLKILTYCY